MFSLKQTISYFLCLFDMLRLIALCSHSILKIFLSMDFFSWVTMIRREWDELIKTIEMSKLIDIFKTFACTYVLSAGQLCHTIDLRIFCLKYRLKFIHLIFFSIFTFFKIKIDSSCILRAMIRRIIFECFSIGAFCISSKSRLDWWLICWRSRSSCCWISICKILFWLWKYLLTLLHLIIKIFQGM